MKFKILLASLLAVLLIGSQAGALAIKGKDVSTISDILRQSNKVISRDSGNLDLEKDSIIRIHDGQLDLHYNIGNGDNDKSLGKINGYSTTASMRDNGFLAAVARTKFGNSKTFITSSKVLSDSSHWFYDLYFTRAYKDENNNLDQSCFDRWRYNESSKSGYIKDIKAGIFVDGFDGEIVVAATMEATNDRPNTAVDFSTKKVNMRLDFWALTTPYDEKPYTTKINDLTTTQDGFETAPLNGITCDDSWRIVNNFKSTKASPYMILKIAVGDLNDDGFENEVAVLTADVKQVALRMYQISYDTDSKKFSIKEMPNSYRVIHTYEEPDWVRTYGYSGWHRMIGAELLAGDYDGDGKTELAAVFWGDPIPSARYAEEGDLFKGGNVVHLFTNLYKWDNSAGTFDAHEKRNERYGMKHTYKAYYSWGGQVGYKRSLYMPWGGIKAVTLDIEGDGTDEIVFAWARSKALESVSDKDRALHDPYDQERTYYSYEVEPYVQLIRWNKSDNEFGDPSHIYNGGAFLSKRIFVNSYNRDRVYGKGSEEDDGKQYEWSERYRGDPFGVEEFYISPLAKYQEYYPVIDREFALTA